MNESGLPAAVIFDFDGVLADTEPLHCRAFQFAAATIGQSLSPDDYYRQFLGLTDRECLAEICRRGRVAPTAATFESLLQRKRSRYAQLLGEVTLFAGMEEVLCELHEVALLAIASGAFRDEIDAVLAGAGVADRFAVIVSAEDVQAGKPAPDGFLCALRRINAGGAAAITAAQCVVVEDSPRGIAAAHAAGMRCIGVMTTQSRAALAAADVVIDHPRNLRRDHLLAALRGSTQT